MSRAIGLLVILILWVTLFKGSLIDQLKPAQYPIQNDKKTIAEY